MHSLPFGNLWICHEDHVGLEDPHPFQYNPLNACQQCNPSESTTAWTQAPNTCIIGGQCYPNGAANPQNGCQICNANQSSTSWTTSANTCTIGGSCYLANESNPDSPCEICVSFTSTTSWTQASNTCNIQGTCYAAGVRRPGQQCQICDPTRTPSGWSNALTGTSCDDGSLCSPIDTCNGAGACTGNTSCDDGIACTKNTCTASGCDNTQVEDNWCRIGGTCRVEGVQNPANQCQACLPGASQASRTVWSNKSSNSSCSDGNACTLNDTCSGTGSCRAGSAKNCSDGLSCTSDSCNTSSGVCSSSLQGGNCLIAGTCYSNNATQANNVCYKCNTSSSTSNWSLNNGVSCNDGDQCTLNDKCSGGSCGGTNDTDPHEANDGITSARALSPYTVCDNQSADSPPTNQSTTAGLYPAGDVDWYRFRIDDRCSNTRQPDAWARLTNIPSGMNYSLCIYYKCDDIGDGEKGSCSSGSNSSVVLDGVTLKGCCSDNAGSASEFVDRYPSCDNGGWGVDDDTGTAYIRVSRTSGTWTCADYTLQYGDN